LPPSLPARRRQMGKKPRVDIGGVPRSGRCDDEGIPATQEYPENVTVHAACAKFLLLRLVRGHQGIAWLANVFDTDSRRQTRGGTLGCLGVGC
jgi:hypothetical protein